MRKILTALMALLMAVMIPFTCLCESTPTLSSKPFTFDTTTLYGKKINSSVFKKYDLIMVNVWAEWCPPCVRELPALQMISKNYGNVLVLGLWWGDSADSAKSTAKEAGVKYPLLEMPNGFASSYLTPEGVTYYIPQTVFFDFNGKQISEAYVGGRDYSSWKSLVDEMLKKAPKRTKIKSITLNKTKATLKKGKTLKLTKKIKPSGATYKTLKWTSSNPKVATVDKNGNVKAIKKGTCTITCTAQDGSGKKATCKITVK